MNALKGKQPAYKPRGYSAPALTGELAAEAGDREVAQVRCAAYLRKSHRKAINLVFNSLEAQHEIIGRFVSNHAHDGWILVDETFEDKAVSGKDTKRSGWQKLMRAVDEGRIDRIIVYKLDRAFRSLADYLHCTTELMAKGVAVVSVTEAFTLDSPFGRAMGNILATFGQLERELTAERIKDCVAERKRRGLYTGGMAPYGYKIDRSDPNNKRLVIDQDAAAEIRLIYQRYSEFQQTTSIVAELRKRGLQIKFRRGKHSKIDRQRQFEVSDIRRFLRNPVYAGLTVDPSTGETYRGEHQAIIEPEQFYQVQDLISHNRSEGKECRRTGVDGILKGIAFCGECRCRMRLTWGQNGKRKYRYYVCSLVIRQQDCQCARRYYSADEIEKVTVAYLLRVFHSPEVTAWVLHKLREICSLRSAELRTSWAGLNEQVAQLQRHLRDAASDNPDHPGLAELKKQIREISIQREQIGSELAGLRETQLTDRDVLARLEQFDEIWCCLQPALQADIVRTVLESATIFDGKVKFRLLVNGVNSLLDNFRSAAAEEYPSREEVLTP